jgi:poly(3-hydroxybutyrate) depolymerase
MTNSVGCYRGDRIRGIAPVAGCGPFSRNATCSGQFAAMIIHSPYDTTTEYASGMQACNSHMTANHCDQSPECGCHWVEALAEDADQCVQEAQAPYMSQQSIDVTEDDALPPLLRQYLNCDPGFPVVHIEHYSGRDPRYHNPPAWAPAVIWEFFSSLPRVE